MRFDTRDAFYTWDGAALTIGTAKIEKTVALDADGRLFMTRLLDVAAGADYAGGGAQPSDEFSVQIDGARVAGGCPGWAAGEVAHNVLDQGELEVALELLRDGLRVERHYVAYPGTAVVQEWTVYENTSGADVRLDRPSLFVRRIGHAERLGTDFAYMTGAGNFTGSNQLKAVAVSDGFTKDFDSNGEPEMAVADGHYADKRHPRYMGAGIWHMFFALRNRERERGVYMTFDYQGWWKGQFTSRDGNTALTGWCELINYPLKAGETMRIAPMMMGAFQGDWDAVGNDIANYIYQYKWDYTRDAYFNRTNMTIWRSAPLREKVFKMAQYAREIGSERLWVDDFWFDAKGNWRNVFGDDFRELNAFLKRSSMLFRLWMPPWHADRLSQVWLDHPDWMIDFHGNWYNWTIDMSKEEAYQWVLDMLTDKQREFGTYDLRVDGDPCNVRNDGSFDTEGGNWNCNFKQSENFYRLYKAFKDRNPEAGLDGCSSGGHTMSIEASRYVDQQQITDGECHHYGGYWTTLILPIDKHQGMNMEGDVRAKPTAPAFRPEFSGQFSAPGVLLQNPLDGMSAAMIEGHRREHELFRYLRDQGVYGRWVQVYRPTIEHGDPTFLLQRMTKNGLRGMIMISPDSHNPILNKSARIYPKGLLPDEQYLIQGYVDEGFQSQSMSGREWMERGVRLEKVAPGQRLFLNLPGRPGCGLDAEPPTEPVAPAAKPETWLGHNGIAISWAPATDNVMVSYYDVSKNGNPLAKVSVGCYHFDESGAAGDQYAVRAVDGDGNASAWVDVQ